MPTVNGQPYPANRWRESGGTVLTAGAVTDGQFLKRSGTTITSAAASGGLTFTASKTGNYTAVAGDFVLCDASGGAFTVTLPAGSDGNQVGLYLSSDSANAVTISGTLAADNHDGKLYVQGDTLILQYSSTLAGWMTIYDGLIPHVGKMYLNASITTNSAATQTKITFDTQSFDVGYIADPTTNKRFDIRRPGKYQVTVQARPNSSMSDGHYYFAFIYQNGSAVSTTAAVVGAITAAVRVNSVTIGSCSAADTIEGYFMSQAANIGCVAGADDTFITVHEVR